ncbi:MAG: hypothetical protein HC908_11825 [Calothrix sp. SM1_7_51]|nr:hypothetical protein [Calothrix sp. SM1_7_51]
MLDLCLFNSNQSAGIIDWTLPDAKKKLKKCKFAYDKLPASLRREIQLTKDNEQELQFSNGSSISADTGYRGDTLQILHISELAKIQKKNPLKAEEIKTGALNAIAPGQIVIIESTAEEGTGIFYNYCHRAEAMYDSGAELSMLDYKFFFFPWYMDQTYQLNPPISFTFSPASNDYFKELEINHGVKLDASQRYWYVKKKEDLGEKILQEFPSTSQEAFRSSTDDKYLKKYIVEARKANRICEFEIEEGIPIDMFYDLGHSDYTSIIFSQVVGKELRIVDFYEDSGMFIGSYIEIVKEKLKNYTWGTTYLPHDAKAKHIESKESVEDIFRSYKVKVEVLPSQSIEVGIDRARRVLKNAWFRKSTTELLVEHLENYAKKWSEQNGIYIGEKHDVHSHAGSCFRYFASKHDFQNQKKTVNIKLSGTKYRPRGL